jgi:hypothetical protein
MGGGAAYDKAEPPPTCFNALADTPTLVSSISLTVVSGH